MYSVELVRWRENANFAIKCLKQFFNPIQVLYSATKAGKMSSDTNRISNKPEFGNIITLGN